MLSLQLPTGSNLYLGLGSSGSTSSLGLDLLDNIQSFGNLTEYNVLSVEPGSIFCTDEKLRSYASNEEIVGNNYELIRGNTCVQMQMLR